MDRSCSFSFSYAPSFALCRSLSRVLGYGFILLAGPLLIESKPAWSQDLAAVGNFEESGIVRAIAAGQITVEPEGGEATVYKVQDKDEDALSLDGDRAIYRLPAEIRVSGTLPINLLEEGMVVEFETQMNRSGKTEEPVASLKVVNADVDEFKMAPRIVPEEDNFETVDVVGRVVRVSSKTIKLEVPESRVARRGQITIKIDPEGTMQLEMDDLNRVQPGDIVNRMAGTELTNGMRIVREIDITMVAERETATTSFHDQLEQQYSDLPDEPTEPRETHSDHFVLYTDISKRQSSILLAKLETMYELIARYYGQRPRDVIECYVVRDLSQWGDKLHPEGVAKIREGAGVTRSMSSGRQAKSIVYSCDKQDIVQHEAVHAFCSMAFGSSGPVWYAEGMAEMGNYWRPRELAVNIDPVVVEYLTSAEPKKLRDIVAAGQITGDSWQAYAWRWALCHLLASNPNYSQRFKQLGMNLMAENGDSFDIAFGPIADQISFEYDQFIENFGNGYRVDLCTWDWETRASSISKRGKSKIDVDAAAGWQATKLEVKSGESYDYVAEETWKISATGEPSTAEGANGEGQLVAVILHDFKLTEPIVFGESGSFVAPYDGQVFLRCNDRWTELADNSGEVEVTFRRTPDEEKGE